MKAPLVSAVPPAGYANTWLIRGNGRSMAVDVGTRRAAHNLYRTLHQKAGIPPDAPLLISATHFHFDHVGGIETLCRLCSGATVRLSHRAAAYAGGTARPVLPAFDRWIMAFTGIVLRMPRIMKGTFYSMGSPWLGMPIPSVGRRRLRFCEPVCNLHDGMSLPELPEWQIIETPGHTPDSICFYHPGEGILLTGDTILNLRGTGELNSFCWDPEAIRRSFERLLALPVEAVYPGHGTPLVGTGRILEGVSLRGF